MLPPLILCISVSYFTVFLFCCVLFLFIILLHRSCSTLSVHRAYTVSSVAPLTPHTIMSRVPVLRCLFTFSPSLHSSCTLFYPDCQTTFYHLTLLGAAQGLRAACHECVLTHRAVTAMVQARGHNAGPLLSTAEVPLCPQHAARAALVVWILRFLIRVDTEGLLSPGTIGLSVVVLVLSLSVSFYVCAFRCVFNALHVPVYFERYLTRSRVLA